MGDGRLLLEAKEDMRKRGMPSRDEGDAAALCFTEPEGSPFPRSIGNFNRKIEYGGTAMPDAKSVAVSVGKPIHPDDPAGRRLGTTSWKATC